MKEREKIADKKYERKADGGADRSWDYVGLPASDGAVSDFA